MTTCSAWRTQGKPFCHIGGSIVQPFINRSYLEDACAAHDATAQVCTENYGIVLDMASINPHFRSADYDREVEYCLCELGLLTLSLRRRSIRVTPTREWDAQSWRGYLVRNVPVRNTSARVSVFCLLTPLAMWLHGAATLFLNVCIVIGHVTDSVSA